MEDHDAVRLLRAAAFAADRHRDQRRKGRSAPPYIVHPIEVATLLADSGITDVDVLCAALLHDVLEDTDATAEVLRASFGDAVTDLVLEVTDDRTLSQAERKRRQVEHAPHLSRGARLVKLADKTANVRDVARDPPAAWSPDRRRRYVDWAVEVADAGLRGVHPGLEARFDAVVAEAYAAIGAETGSRR